MSCFSFFSFSNNLTFLLFCLFFFLISQYVNVVFLSSEVEFRFSLSHIKIFFVYNELFKLFIVIYVFCIVLLEIVNYFNVFLLVCWRSNKRKSVFIERALSSDWVDDVKHLQHMKFCLFASIFFYLFRVCSP